MSVLNGWQSDSQPRFPWYKERLQKEYLKNSRNELKLTAGLNSHNWIFLPKGLDDFRDGYPSCSETTFIPSRKEVFPGLQNATYEKDPTEKMPTKKLTKEQACFSKVLPRQQARRAYIAQIEYGLTQHPLALYPELEEAVPPELFEEIVDVIDPEMRLKSALGSYEAEEDEELEDDDKFSTSHKEPQDLLSVKSREESSRQSTLSGQSRQKNPYTWLSKKEESLKEENKLKTNRNLAPALDESVKHATKEFCDWVTSLGGESGSVNESSIYSLFATDYDTKPALSVPIHVVELNNVPAELRKSVGMTARQSNLKNSQSKLLHPSAEFSYRPNYIKSRYGAWYLDPKTWKKIKINEPLKDPNLEKLAKSTDSNNKLSQKDEDLLQLHGTMAFKEFTENEGYRKPEMTQCVINTLHHIFYTTTSIGHQKFLAKLLSRKHPGSSENTAGAGKESRAPSSGAAWHRLNSASTQEDNIIN